MVRPWVSRPFPLVGIFVLLLYVHVILDLFDQLLRPVVQPPPFLVPLERGVSGVSSGSGGPRGSPAPSSAWPPLACRGTPLPPLTPPTLGRVRSLLGTPPPVGLNWPG